MHEMKVDGKLEYREPMTPTEFACEFNPTSLLFSFSPNPGGNEALSNSD